MLYSVLSLIVFVLIFPVLLLHPKLRGGLRQRLGLHGNVRKRDGADLTVWFHAASAGDVLSIKPIVEGIRKKNSRAAIVVSTITNSGMDMARKKLCAVADTIIYAPFDIVPAVRRACAAIGPQLLVLEYTEIWPNMLRCVRRSGAAVILVNGRFSPRRFPNYKALFRVTGNLMKQIDLLLMRGQGEAARAVALGAARERVIVTGSTKFDNLPLGADHPALRRTLRRQMKIPQDAPAIVAGSTHEGEEEMLLDVFGRLIRSHAGLRLLVAPRYPERAAALVKMAAARQMSCCLRTRPMQDSQLIAVDTMGELATLYCVADVAVVGGSFVPRGGQNILEPAACRVPVLFGPHMENFEDAYEILQGRGGIMTKDGEVLFTCLSSLLSDRAKAAELGMMAYEAVLGVAGAAEKNVELISGFLSRRSQAKQGGEACSGGHGR